MISGSPHSPLASTANGFYASPAEDEIWKYEWSLQLTVTYPQRFNTCLTLQKVNNSQTWMTAFTGQNGCLCWRFWSYLWQNILNIYKMPQPLIDDAYSSHPKHLERCSWDIHYLVVFFIWPQTSVNGIKSNINTVKCNLWQNHQDSDHPKATLSTTGPLMTFLKNYSSCLDLVCRKYKWNTQQRRSQYLNPHFEGRLSNKGTLIKVGIFKSFFCLLAWERQA